MLAERGADTGGHLLANLLLFSRLLRGLGFHITTRQVYELARGLTHVNPSRREDFYFATRSFFVHGPDEVDAFDRAFELFWSGQQTWMLESGNMRSARLARRPNAPPRSDPAALGNPVRRELPSEDEPDDPPGRSASLTYSSAELLRHKDFSKFTEEEMETARRFIRSLIWRLEPRLTRRQVRAAKRAAYLDIPQTVRDNMRHGGEMVCLAWRRRKLKPRPLVVICDISGSMERYSRLFLHFMYALVQGSRQIEAFVFGTRLTRLTPALRHRDVDATLAEMSELVLDWAGGTRIGESLKAFNYQWSRRVLGRGAIAIVISDGWDRGEIDLLDREMDRLRRSVSRLIWLNPLLGSPGYEPLVRGMQAALPYVDEFLALHNLVSLERLAFRLGTLREAQ